jgi:hypothetical protein
VRGIFLAMLYLYLDNNTNNVFSNQVDVKYSSSIVSEASMMLPWTMVNTTYQLLDVLLWECVGGISKMVWNNDVPRQQLGHLVNKSNARLLGMDV